METTDPPVKVLLADGVDETGAGAVEQLPLIHCLPAVSLLHLLLLPRITGVNAGWRQRTPATKHRPPGPRNTFYERCHEASSHRPVRLQPRAGGRKRREQGLGESRGKPSLQRSRPALLPEPPKQTDQPLEGRCTSSHHLASAWSLARGAGRCWLGMGGGASFSLSCKLS